MGPKPLTIQELRVHPSVPAALSLPSPTSHGLACIKTSQGDSVSLSYQTFGSGPIKVLWINGHGATLRYMRRPMIDFGTNAADLYTSCFFSHRGYEGSSDSWSFVSPKTGAEDVLGLLDHLGWTKQREVHIVGFSMGGYIAQNLALLSPQRIASLTLMSSTSRFADNFTLSSPWTQGVLSDLIPRGENGRIESTKRKLFGPDWPSEADEEGLFPTNGDHIAVEAFLNQDASVGKGPILQMPGNAMHHISPEQLAQIAEHVGHKRIQVIHGSHDQMFDISHGEKLHAGLGGTAKGVQIHILPRAGHMGYVERRAQLREILPPFWREAINEQT